MNTKHRKRDLSRHWRLFFFYTRHFVLWLCLALAAYWLWLDRVLVRSFDVQQWAIPTRIYASPVELYQGAKITPQHLEAVLLQLGYSNAGSMIEVGSFSKFKSGFLVNSRGYPFSEGAEPPRKIKIKFANNLISGLSDVETGEPLALAQLEPVEIGSVHTRTFEDRVVVSLSQMPEEFLDMLLAVEDRRFYGHFGVDPIGIARAVVSNLRSGAITQGGSTITQQLVKNMYLSNERSYARKLQEALMAISLELHYSKAEIFEAYINEIFLGQDGNRAIHGFGLAAQFFFGKRLETLNIGEFATLIGMVKAPSSYHPIRHPLASRKRRELVLDLALKQGVISQVAHAKERAQGLGVRPQGAYKSGDFGGFIDVVRLQLAREYRESDLQRAGLKIYTTLDLTVQEATRRQAARGLTELERANSIDPNSLQTAVVIVDVATAELRAVVGGRDQSSVGFNRALNANRPIGSLVKPFVYLTALERSRDFNVLSALNDEPIAIVAEGGGTWTPKNYDSKTHGAVSVRHALTQSYNLATINLGLDIGVDAVARQLEAFGVERALKDFPSLLLGALDLTPIEVAQLYQAIANDGFKVPLRAIRAVADKHNNVLTRYPPKVEQVTDAATAFLTKYLLVGVVNEGTAKSAARFLPQSLPLAGKTGTSNDGRDSWFAGFGSDSLGVVWVGRDDNGQTGLTGASGALRLWISLMRQIGIDPVEFGSSDGIQWAWVSPGGQMIVGELCDGAQRIPLALPHGLEEDRSCLPEAGTVIRDQKQKRLWDRVRGLFQ